MTVGRDAGRPQDSPVTRVQLGAVRQPSVPSSGAVVRGFDMRRIGRDAEDRPVSNNTESPTMARYIDYLHLAVAILGLIMDIWRLFGR